MKVICIKEAVWRKVSLTGEPLPLLPVYVGEYYHVKKTLHFFNRDWYELEEFVDEGFETNMFAVPSEIDEMEMERDYKKVGV